MQDVAPVNLREESKAINSSKVMKNRDSNLTSVNHVKHINKINQSRYVS